MNELYKNCFNCGKRMENEYGEACQQCIKKIIMLGDKRVVVKGGNDEEIR